MRRIVLKQIAIISTALALCSSLFPALAQAYSGYGLGTSANPYRIGTCSQLEEINNNLSGYYVLVSNIDCSGSTFTHLADSTAFSGTLDGQDHTISNLNLDTDALFNLTNDATIENINIASGSVTSANDFAASFVADATNTTLANLHSAMTVTAINSGSYAGGLVGWMQSNDTLQYSSFTGTIGTTVGYSGGLAAYMSDSGSSISNSYSAATVNDNGAYVGEIVGGMLNGTVNNVYSAGAYTYTGSDYQGPFVGLAAGGTISNSFSATTITGSSNGHDGGFVGLNTGTTFSNDYYDQFLSANNAVACSNSSCSSGVTAENVSNASPAYFKDSTTNGPFSQWDFTHTWSTSSTYPTLQDSNEFNSLTGVPNNGDANGDGIQDSYQANVLDLESNSGNWVTISVPSSSGCTLGNSQSLSGTSIPTDSGYTKLSNLLDFDGYCPSPGMTIPVTLIFSRLINTSGAQLQFYNPNTKAYSVINGATFSTVNIGGNTETEVHYSLTDGGPYDLSGVANGLIEDPVLIAAPATSVSAPDTGEGAYTNNVTVVIFTLLSVSMIVSGSLLLSRNYKGD